MSKHTPGPWHVVTEQGRPVVKCANDFYITNTVDAAGYESDDDTMFANARLIAAAPDLLAVLQELQESSSYWSEYDVPLGIVDRINSAIAKATGEKK